MGKILSLDAREVGEPNLLSNFKGRSWQARLRAVRMGVGGWERGIGAVEISQVGVTTYFVSKIRI